jgi:hypothetical protein
MAVKKTKLKKFVVNYYFDGNGACTIEARTAKEAEQKFRDGEFNEADDHEWGENFCVESIEKK